MVVPIASFEAYESAVKGATNQTVVTLFIAPWKHRIALCEETRHFLRSTLRSRSDTLYLEMDLSQADVDEAVERGISDVPCVLVSQGNTSVDLLTEKKAIFEIESMLDKLSETHVPNPVADSRNPVDYAVLIAEVARLIKGERDVFTNTANTSAAIHQAIHSARGSEGSNWTGFYFVRQLRASPGQKLLLLGPFQGKPACKRIEIGKGVCGTAVSKRSVQLVYDVHEFPGHIACDAASQSEIVVPIIVDGTVTGVLDIDCPEINGFNRADRDGLMKVVELLQEGCNWNLPPV